MGVYYQARKKSVNVSRAVKSAKTIQYIIHLTYLATSIIQISWVMSNLVFPIGIKFYALFVSHSLTFLVLTAL